MTNKKTFKKEKGKSFEHSQLLCVCAHVNINTRWFSERKKERKKETQRGEGEE